MLWSTRWSLSWRNKVSSFKINKKKEDFIFGKEYTKIFCAGEVTCIIHFSLCFNIFASPSILSSAYCYCFCCGAHVTTFLRWFHLIIDLETILTNILTYAFMWLSSRCFFWSRLRSSLYRPSNGNASFTKDERPHDHLSKGAEGLWDDESSRWEVLTR